jgi:UDP-N-acetylglucosamine transferase subunit ALG13
MIFITVGTHEQPFDRLVKEIDLLRQKEIIKEPVFTQTGYSSYKPKFCEYSKFIAFNEMMKKIENARIVITHGGPGSIMPVFYTGKVPIVVPRQKKYGEHVDDHQIYFCKKLEKKGKIIAVYKVKDLEYKIQSYDELAKKLKQTEKEKVSSNEEVQKFAIAIEKLCEQLMKKRGI